MTNKDPIPMYWWFRTAVKTNFGDIVSPMVVKILSGREVVFSTGENKLVASGSVLVHARDGDFIWGTGAHFPHEGNKHKLKILAVRGPLTRKRLEQDGHKCPELYGDPTILLPHLFKPEVEEEYDFGIIPHYVDYDHTRNGMHRERVNVINVLSGVKNVITEVNKCPVILSSCLHGIILAESYGIPTCWIRVSNKIASKEFKFKDYYSSTARDVTVVDWTDRWQVTRSIRRACSINKPLFDRERFLLSFPYLKENIKSLSDLQPEILNESWTDIPSSSVFEAT